MIEEKTKTFRLPSKKIRSNVGIKTSSLISLLMLFANELLHRWMFQQSAVNKLRAVRWVSKSNQLFYMAHYHVLLPILKPTSNEQNSSVIQYRGNLKSVQ